jgi:hypothetical protein
MCESNHFFLNCAAFMFRNARFRPKRNATVKGCSASIAVALGLAWSALATLSAAPVENPPSAAGQFQTIKNVSYGPHARHLMDIYLPAAWAKSRDVRD